MSTAYSRRTALRSLGIWAAASPLLKAQETQSPKLMGEPPGRIAPRSELLNVFEVEAMAERKLPSTVFSAIAGGDRRAFERIIFRPRRFINPVPLDLTVELFGEKMYTPILVGPASQQQRFDPEGELALVRGGSAAKVTAVISSRSSQPIEKIAAEAKGTTWYQVYPESDMGPVLNGVGRAVKAGCKVVCVTAGNGARLDWDVVDQVRQAAKTPVVLKGVLSAEEARTAVGKGVDGIIVSNHGGLLVPGLAAPIEVLTAVVDAVGGKVPVLIDGSFRRGSDIVKALALGARAVLVVRPVLWGLAGYGSEGVQTVLEILQSETVRTMGLNGKPTLALLDRTMVRISKH
jgi:4-hydroxymandelate oxidase